MQIQTVAVILALSAFMPNLASADTMRCGDKLIVTGDSTSKVLLTCGEPFLKESLSTEEEKLKDNTPQGSKTTAVEVLVEKWTYTPGEGKFIKVLIFRDGLLDEIETGDRI